jgi:putative tryptophan/tyrosine transport system substrate-binding protein
MKRRKFIGLIGGAMLPLVARAEQPVPVIGFLSNVSPEGYDIRLRAFREGLKAAGYVEGQNVAIEYRWAKNQNDQLPELAAELVRRQVSVIVAAGGTVSALAAKKATATIPIVFAVTIDPVKLGLVASLRRPGGNLTGATDLNVEVGPKRLELLRELLPLATKIAVLVNPTSQIVTEPFLQALQPAARELGIQFQIVNASTDAELDGVFASLRQLRASALLITPDGFFYSQSERLGALSLRYAIPAIYERRPFAASGGLISYGSDDIEYYRLVGSYAGKILHGDKPADMPIVQSTKIELIVNLKTAKALAITIPLALLGRADEVIE